MSHRPQLHIQAHGGEPVAEVYSRRWECLPATSSKGFTARTGHTVVEHDGDVYLFGGTDQHRRQNDLYRLDLASQSWIQIPAKGCVPSRRSGAVGCVMHGKMYLFGGYDGREGNYFNDLYEFNFETTTWRRIYARGRSNSVDEDEQPVHRGQAEWPTEPSPRTDHVLVSYGDSLYVFGGFDGIKRFDEVWAFDINTRVWRVETEEQMNKPTPRFGHTGVVYEDAFWVFGGWDGRDTLDCMWRYDLKARTWDMVEPQKASNGRRQTNANALCPRHRYRHSAVTFDGGMFLFGGVDKDHVRFNDLFRFDFATRSWEEIEATGIIPSSRTFHRCVVVGNKMYLLGGYDGDYRLNDVRSVYLGNLSPPPLKDICAEYIRCNLQAVQKTCCISGDVASHLTSLIWSRDASNVLRGGIHNKTKTTCTGFEGFRVSPIDTESLVYSSRGDALIMSPSSAASSPAGMDRGQRRLGSRCAACGYAAGKHEPIDEATVFQEAMWQPDCERSTDHSNASRAAAGGKSSSSLLSVLTREASIFLGSSAREEVGSPTKKARVGAKYSGRTKSAFDRAQRRLRRGSISSGSCMSAKSTAGTDMVVEPSSSSSSSSTYPNLTTQE
jgi:N-acetylneuraminic acid mutarotase